MDIFDEDEDFILYRFSLITLFVFLYYSLSYFFLYQEPIKKPHFSIFLLMLFLHISHIIFLKFLHVKNYYNVMWMSAIFPIFLYFIYSKYIKYIKKQKEQKEQEMYNKIMEQQKSNINFVNPSAQTMNIHPVRSQEYVSLSKNQHLQPLTQQNNLSNSQNQQMDASRNISNTQQDMQQGMQQGMQHTNNSIVEEIQHQPLDSTIGINAGNDLLGFDPYSANMASFF